MITITIGRRRNPSGAIKAPLSMPGRMFMELMRNDLGRIEGSRMVLPPGVSIRALPPPPLTTLAGLMFRLGGTKPRYAGHAPHSLKTPMHELAVNTGNPFSDAEMAARLNIIFKNWPRVQVTTPAKPD